MRQERVLKVVLVLRGTALFGGDLSRDDDFVAAGSVRIQRSDDA